MDRRAFLRTAGTSLGMAAVLQGAATAQAAPRWQTSAAGLATGTRAEVATDTLNLRGGPGADEPRVGHLAGGQRVDLLGATSDGAWWRLAADDQVGYVDGAYLQATGEPVTPGVFDLDLAFPYSPQRTAVWCDPADIEMWLAYRQQRPAQVTSTDLQAAIWAWETSHNGGYTVDQWDCSPFAVAAALGHWMPDAGFDHFRAEDAKASTRLLAWLLAHPAYREPSVALIWRGDHYVLVRGVRALGDAGQNPAGAQILGLYVADPNQASRTWLGSDRYIPLATWLNELLTPVSYLTPHTGFPGDPWQDQFVTIQRSWTAGGPTPQGRLNARPDQYV